MGERRRPLVKRASFRDLFRAAGDPATSGWRLVGPHGDVAERVDAATTPLRRIRGLLGRHELAAGEALIIQPCHEVHTLGMHFSIDAVFCDRDLRVIAVETLPPGRLSRPHRSWCCIELPAGTAEACGIEVGTRLTLEGPKTEAGS